MLFLLADDSRTTRNIIKSYIKEFDLDYPPDFMEADTPESVVSILETHQIEMAFLDWNFNAKVTGLDLLKQIRATEKLKKMPVIMVTSESDKSNVIIALKAGANDFVVKPIDKKIFEEKTLRVINSIKYA